MNVKNIYFPSDQYYKNTTKKDSICLHHTVSPNSKRHPNGVRGDIQHWKNSPQRVATSTIIDYDGTIYKLFDESYWAHHLGIKRQLLKKYGSTVTNTFLNKKTIGIEIDSLGPLTKVDDKYYSVYGHEIPEEDVYKLDTPFRGHKYFEKYTDEQIDAVIELIQHYGNTHEIDICYRDDMWEVSEDALSGVPGLWAHVSFRPDKSDVYPDHRLIEKLQQL